MWGGSLTRTSSSKVSHAAYKRQLEFELRDMKPAFCSLPLSAPRRPPISIGSVPRTPTANLKGPHVGASESHREFNPWWLGAGLQVRGEYLYLFISDYSSSFLSLVKLSVCPFHCVFHCFLPTERWNCQESCSSICQAHFLEKDTWQVSAASMSPLTTVICFCAGPAIWDRMVRSSLGCWNHAATVIEFLCPFTLPCFWLDGLVCACKCAFGRFLVSLQTLPFDKRWSMLIVQLRLCSQTAGIWIPASLTSPVTSVEFRHFPCLGFLLFCFPVTKTDKNSMYFIGLLWRVR